MTFFLSKSLTLSEEKYIVESIHKFAVEIVNKFWQTNRNFFLVVYDRFPEINRSICYEVNPVQPKKGPYTFPKPTFTVEFF